MSPRGQTPGSLLPLSCLEWRVGRNGAASASLSGGRPTADQSPDAEPGRLGRTWRGGGCAKVAHGSPWGPALQPQPSLSCPSSFWVHGCAPLVPTAGHGGGSQCSVGRGRGSALSPAPLWTLYTVSSSILIGPRFTDGGSEAQRSKATCPRSHSKWNLGPPDFLPGGHRPHPTTATTHPQPAPGSPPSQGPGCCPSARLQPLQERQ